ncbi:uncharacterized protein N7483_010311 [Penicillium malachiteum]|uniref:uncharacterized protein n=1 Tax=Penicillium malachiteum TaxID=1324776 RepID=UPI0025471514|nr:uncharacterized protein N7483_010311 [Penicillium malachiteum]KAJ5713130.1 hypothetical protein N7483_010311 [Penicillium malachiteum]
MSHLAAVCLAKGQPFELQTRPTPKPGPGELLIAAKSVALNPADCIMRDQGLFIPSYPTVIGFDVAGLVLEVGDNVPVNTTDDELGPSFRPGVTRVAGYSASFWRSFDPDYGIFQERCLVPWQHVIPLPDTGISWNEAASLPVSCQVPLNAWDLMGISRIGETPSSSTPAPVRKSDVLLIWGATSSVGSMGVQTARLLCEDPTSSFAAVYATAGAVNMQFVASLGADRVFDYKEPRVVDIIVSAAKVDGLGIRHCFLANGKLELCQAVLKAFVGDNQAGKRQKAMIASAPVIPPGTEMEGIETVFVFPSLEEEERLAQFQYWMGWPRKNLASGAIRPSPELKIVGKGLEAINAGLDMLSRGVSCTKLVVEISE